MVKTHHNPLPFLISFLLSSWPAVRPYRQHLEERDPIWDWSHSHVFRRSPVWGFLGFSSAARQMPGDLCTAPRNISLSTLSLASDVAEVTLEASGLWLGTRTGAGGTATVTESFFWPLPMAPWTTAHAWRSVHSPQDHFIITLIISDRSDGRDTRGKWPLARNPDRSWWHRHTTESFFGRSPWLHGQQERY